MIEEKQNRSTIFHYTLTLLYVTRHIRGAIFYLIYSKKIYIVKSTILTYSRIIFKVWKHELKKI